MWDRIAKPETVALSAALLFWAGSADPQTLDPDCVAAVDKAAGRYSRCLLRAEARFATHPDSRRLEERREKCRDRFARKVDWALGRFETGACTSPSLLDSIEAEVETSARKVAVEAAGKPFVTLLFVQSATNAVLTESSLLLTGVGGQTAWFADRPGRETGQSSTGDFVNLWDVEGVQSFSESPPNASLACEVAGEQVNAVVELIDAMQPDPDSVHYEVKVLSGCPGGEVSCELVCDHSHLFIDSAIQGVCLPPASFAMKNNYFKLQPESLPYDVDYFLNGAERFLSSPQRADMTKVLVRVPGPTLLTDPKWLSKQELVAAVAAKAQGMPAARFLWLPDLTADFTTVSTAPADLVAYFQEWRSIVEQTYPGVADRVFEQLVLEPEGSVWHQDKAADKKAIWDATRQALPAEFALGWTGTHEAILKLERPSTGNTLFGAIDGDLFLQIYNIYPPCDTVGAWTDPLIKADLNPDAAFCASISGTQCTGACTPGPGESIYGGSGLLSPTDAGHQVAEIIGAYIRNQQNAFGTSASWWERMHFMFSYEQATSAGSPPPALLGTTQFAWGCQEYSDFASTFESDIISAYGSNPWGNVTRLNLGVYIPVNAFQRWDATQNYVPE